MIQYHVNIRYYAVWYFICKIFAASHHIPLNIDPCTTHKIFTISPAIFITNSYVNNICCITEYKFLCFSIFILVTPTFLDR
eukprot:UN04868